MHQTDYTSRTFFGVEVLFRCYTGPLTTEQEKEMLTYAVTNGLINENVKGMVLDMRMAEFDFQPEDAHQIIDFVSKDPLLASLKYAILVDSPDQIIYPLLGAMYKESAKLKPFSTEAAAIKWIIAE